MSVVEPKYRRPLNDEQVAVLELLFRFRFGTGELFASYFGKQLAKAIQKRLSILETQDFIAKHYDGSYKLKGKPAEYYLLAKGARLLRQTDRTTVYKIAVLITDQAIKNRYKDKTASETFIKHSVNVFRLSLQFGQLYGDSLGFFTKSDLQPHKYFIKPLPDAYLSLKTTKTDKTPRKRYFVEVFEDDIPLFVIIRRIKKYLQYQEEEEDKWGDSFPAVLMITESSKRQKQLQRRIAKELRDSYLDEEDIVFASTTLESVAGSLTIKDKIWQVVDEEKSMKALSSIHVNH